MQKEELIRLIESALLQEIKKFEENIKTLQQAVIDAPGAMESHSDTTKFQMRAAMQNIENTINERRDAIVSLEKFIPFISKTAHEKIQLGSLVTLEDPTHEQKIFFLLPCGGNISITLENEMLRTITPQTPLVQTMMGKKEKDQFSIGPKTFIIVSIK